MEISIYGHFNVDFIIRVVDLPRSAGSIPAQGVSIRPGGTGRNISRVLGELNVENELISFVGEEFPKEFISDLSNFSHTNKIKIKRGFGYSPSCFIVSNGIEQMAIIDQGPMENPDEIVLPDGKIVHFSTGNPDYYIKIKNSFEGKLLSFDPGQEIFYRYDNEKFTKMIYNTEFSFFNEREFSKAIEFLPENEMKKLSKNIIVTLGEKGCLLINSEKKRLNAYPASAKETVGAGDSFRAGFYYGIINKYSVVDSCKIGMKVASEIIMNGSVDSHLDINEIIDSL